MRQVPTLSVIENFAYLKLPSGDLIHPFGPPGRHLQSLYEALPNCRGDEISTQLPISEKLRVCTEEGYSLLEANKTSLLNGPKEYSGDVDSSCEEAFDLVAEKVIRRVYEESSAEKQAPSVTYNEKRKGFVVRWTEYIIDQGEAAREVVLSPEDLRYADPMDGSKVEEEGGRGGCVHHPVEAVVPLSLEVRGNYAVHIKWSDGYEHAFFTYDAILAVAAMKQTR